MKRANNLPQIEKYRPKSLDDIVHQEDVVRILRKCVENGNLSHLLFYGPAGTGKTSTILALAYQLFGSSDLIKDRVLELNASDERGINVVREKIKSFAQVAVSKNKDGNQSKDVQNDSLLNQQKSSVPPFKIIILDEADSMTRDAQSALRRTMEKYSSTTRFCLICNYVSRIISPITSRCAKFRFKPLNHLSIVSKLKQICSSENIDVNDEAQPALVKLSGGDMRKAINLLQSARAFVCQTKQIMANDIQRVSEYIPDEIVEKIVSDVCLTYKENEKIDFSSLQKITEEILADGFDMQQFLEQFSQKISETSAISDISKAKISMKIGETDHNLNEGASEYLQILNLLSYANQLYTDDQNKSEKGEQDFRNKFEFMTDDLDTIMTNDALAV